MTSDTDFAHSDPAGRDHPVETQPEPSWIFIDTETNKLPDYKQPADAPDQPRLAALTMIFCKPDLTAESTKSFLIKPDGWVMEPEAGAINGLTTEFLNDHGIPVILALEAYVAAIDEGRAVAAFGAQFDCKVMRGELRRHGIDDRFVRTPNFCVMRKSMGFVKKLNGKGGWPGLKDACAHFNIENGGPHTSLGDAMAGLQTMRWLKKLGVPLVPTVHYAKEKSDEHRGAQDRISKVAGLDR